jgi:hypothetical protein
MAVRYEASAGLPNQKNYRLTRLGVAPLDVRIEALMYAQEGSFFVIPGPWFNPDPNDTYERYTQSLRRAGESAGTTRITPAYPFYGEPMDIRLTVFGAVAQNLPAEVGDQTEWLEKWGWIPHYFGSTGLPSATGYPTQGGAIPTVHGRNGGLPGPVTTGPNSIGNGLLYVFDDRMVAPYAPGTVVPLRPSPFNPSEPLPVVPNLPMAPGLLYRGENPVR